MSEPPRHGHCDRISDLARSLRCRADELGSMFPPDSIGTTHRSQAKTVGWVSIAANGAAPAGSTSSFVQFMMDNSSYPPRSGGRRHALMERDTPDLGDNCCYP